MVQPLEDMPLPRLRQLRLMTQRYLTEPAFAAALDKRLYSKFGARAVQWNLPAAAAKVHDDVVKLISQMENDDAGA